MKTSSSVIVPPDPKSKLWLYSIFVTVLLICGVYFFGNVVITQEHKERLIRWGVINPVQNIKSHTCKNRCRASVSEALPEGIISRTSNLDMQPLWGSNLKDNNSKPLRSLLAIPVGIKQKEVVNQIVEKFSSNDFVLMLFHYDGNVDGWRDFTWNNHVIHVSAMNQTKWWFAKRFLHPDIVAEYNYIFLWDEDIGVANFNPNQYISIIKEEGLEISQPALDPTKSKVHHLLTARRKGSKVHRRFYKTKGSGRCDGHSTAPPCIGWVEMMAPVFSREAWQCVWYMVQSDLIHAWGLDQQLGYCAQGDRMKNVGIVDEEYIVHLGLPTLGASNGNEATNSHADESRSKVRMQSYIEMKVFKERWDNAVKEDKCWVDPYEH